MHCAACSISIIKNLEKENGISRAKVNVATGKAIVSYDEKKINPKIIKNIIIKNGYQVENDKKGGTEERQHRIAKNQNNLKIKVIISIIFTLPILSRMFWQWETPGQFLGAPTTEWIQQILAFLVVFFLGRQFHKNAFTALKKLRADMDSLISLGTLTAYFYSLWAMFSGQTTYFETAATLTSILLLGRYMEIKTKNRASRAMEKLMQLGVKKAIVIKNGNEIEKNIDDIKINDIVLVKAGEKIALDGIIIEGGSNIDESMLTGESLPVYKKIGNNVFGGTINQNGIIKIRVKKEAQETMLAKIIKTVEETQNFKPPIQKLADKISEIFVPTVILISLLTFAGWYLATQNISIAMINAVTVLIISCPCALGIATPMAVMVGTSVGAKNGILIKDGESFEKAKDINVIMLDKTGTLTEGKPNVKKIIENGCSKEKILKIANSLASKSNHPISEAIGLMKESKNISIAELKNFKETPGQGLSAECREHGTKLLLGNIRLLRENKVNIKWANQIINDNAGFGGTVLFASHEKEVIGAFLIADKLKNNSRQLIDKIKQLKIRPILISGDNKYASKNTAKELGIDEYYFEVLPQDKQKKVKKLQNEGKKVVFAGDGINDAPALVQADLGIAVGSSTDIAKESGGIIIIKNDPLKIIEAIELSKKTFSVIKENLFWAFFYNGVAIPLAVFGIVSPMIAAVAMIFSDITVIGNSLRIYKNK